MTEPDRQTAAQSAVKALLQADKRKALALAVLLASSSVSSCSLAPQNQPCPDQVQTAPCVQPSGTAASWLERPRWPAQETGPGEGRGVHLATRDDFVANPQYTQLRAGEQNSGGPASPGGGGHVFFFGGGHGGGGGVGVHGGGGAGG